MWSKLLMSFFASWRFKLLWTGRLISVGDQGEALSAIWLTLLK